MGKGKRNHEMRNKETDARREFYEKHLLAGEAGVKALAGRLAEILLSGYEVWASMYETAECGRIPLMVVVGHDTPVARSFMGLYRREIYEAIDGTAKLVRDDSVALGRGSDLRVIVYNEPHSNHIGLFYLDKESFMAVAKIFGVNEQMATYDFLAFSDFADAVSIITHDYDYTAA